MDKLSNLNKANLLKQLKGYGLNPMHWEVAKIIKNRVHFKHCQEPDLKLAGWLVSQNLRDLQLIGL